MALAVGRTFVFSETCIVSKISRGTVRGPITEFALSRELLTSIFVMAIHASVSN